MALDTFEKGPVSILVRAISILVLSFAFLWQAYTAIKKYYDEPTSTKISYRMGDSDAGMSTSNPLLSNSRLTLKLQFYML